VTDWWQVGAGLALVAVVALAVRQHRSRRKSGRESWTGTLVWTIASVVREYRGDRTKSQDPWALRYSLAILVAGGVVAAGAFLFAYRSIDGEDKDRADVGVKAAAATAAVAAGVLTWGRLELSRREHRLSVDQDITERYGRAVEQLGNEQPIIRAGGVYALERVALDAFALNGVENETDWRMAIDLIAAFVRQALTLPEPHMPTAVPGDVLAALEVLGRFNKRSRAQKWCCPGLTDT
jgi:hypothetical protein